MAKAKKFVGIVDDGVDPKSESFATAREAWEWLVQERENEEKQFSSNTNKDAVNIIYTDVALRLRKIAESKDGFIDWDGAEWDVNSPGEVLDEVSSVRYVVEKA